jgi:hypothetical protein
VGGIFAAPKSYAPKYLAERILASKAALAGERKGGHRAVRRPLPHAETLVELTPGQAGPCQMAEKIRRHVEAAPASR